MRRSYGCSARPPARPAEEDHPLRSFGLAGPEALVGLIQYAHTVLVRQAAERISGEDWYRQKSAGTLNAKRPPSFITVRTAIAVTGKSVCHMAELQITASTGYVIC